MAEGKAVFESVAEIFDRPYYSDCKNERKPRGKNRSHTKAIRKAAGLDPEMTGDKPDSTSPPGVNPQAAAS